MKDREGIDDLIVSKNLTPEELELHGELIAECRRREHQIEKCAEGTRQSLQRLGGALRVISERTTELGRALTQLVEDAETLYLKSLPEEEFVRE
jgi:hypothetical protein